MSGVKSNDRRLASRSIPVATQAQHDQAYAYLRRRHTEGTLPPIHGWTGSTLEGYVSILGVRQ